MRAMSTQSRSRSTARAGTLVGTRPPDAFAALSRKKSRTPSEEPSGARAAWPGFDFGTIPISPKLTVGHSDDHSEREARHVAAQVMDTKKPARITTGLVGVSQVGTVGRMCAGCAQEDEQVRREVGTAGSEMGGTVAPPIIHEVLRGAGRPLGSATRAFFEPRFGRDFRDVRIHADARAAESARAVDALAYTVGRHIVLGSTRYDEGSLYGRRVLAHELVHVVQQGGAGQHTGVQRLTSDEEPGNEAAEAEAPAQSELADQGVDAGTNGADAIEAKSGCAGSNTIPLGIKNFKPIDFTIPAGCKATVQSSAIWQYDGDCCDGADTYDIVLNGKKHSMPVAPNICGDRTDEKKPATGSFELGSGRQNGRINANRKGCAGIILDGSLTITYHK